MSNEHSASTEGRALYHAAWELVGERFFDTSRLEDWTSWRNRFDSLIDTEESAVPYIVEMVASLGDSYTRVVGLLPPAVDTGTEEAPKPASRAPSQNDVLYRQLQRNIGYIRICSFEQPDIVDQVTAAAEVLAECSAYIIDLRDNGGGAVDAAASCCEFFMEKGPIGSIERRLPEGKIWHRDVGLVDEGLLYITRVTGEDERMEGYIRRKSITTGKPVVVMINENTGSAAEMIAAAIIESDRSSGRIVSLGTPSFGKGIAQQQISVLDRLVIQMTTAHFMSPTDVWFGDAQQSVRNPVVPDILVEGEVEEACKVQLQAAYQHLERQLLRAA